MSNDLPLDVIEVQRGQAFVFGGVYAANDGYYAEVHEQLAGKVRRVARSESLPHRELAVAWMAHKVGPQSNAA
ncbi:hypothetical protein [Niveibacterium sp. SC-1]|uniref:hypothetical protein n=1 Tax=Niveibacterium sp. SC-1 TaxID=3135646 RepID=UPI00311F7A27